MNPWSAIAAVSQHPGCSLGSERLQLFFFAWAFERAGAPRSYRIAAVKSVSSLKASQGNISQEEMKNLPNYFRKFCTGKVRESANPCFDPKIVELSIPSIVQLVDKGKLSEAFQKLQLKGIGHKIRAFFLRDIATLRKAEPKLGKDTDAYLWCQPIDVWVRFAVEELCETGTIPPVSKDSARYRLSRKDLAVARSIVKLSIAAGVSPLNVNQGIWYFSSNAVADQARLRDLIRCGDCSKLDDELALMKGFLPQQPMWG